VATIRQSVTGRSMTVSDGRIAEHEEMQRPKTKSETSFLIVIASVAARSRGATG
jgi:hypothetical protein